MTIGELFEQQAKKLGDKVFLYWDDITVTYDQLNKITNKVANMLYELGIRKGDKVSVWVASDIAGTITLGNSNVAIHMLEDTTF